MRKLQEGRTRERLGEPGFKKAWFLEILRGSTKFGEGNTISMEAVHLLSWGREEGAGKESHKKNQLVTAHPPGD